MCICSNIIVKCRNQQIFPNVVNLIYICLLLASTKHIVRHIYDYSSQIIQIKKIVVGRQKTGRMLFGCCRD